MPLTKTGEKILAELKAKHGSKKGKEIFYASIRKNIPGSSKWHISN